MTENFVMIGSKRFPVIWSEERDSGGMFKDSVGVLEDAPGQYVAYIKWWGGGRHSPHHDTIEAARQDVERLWEETYGW